MVHDLSLEDALTKPLRTTNFPWRKDLFWKRASKPEVLEEVSQLNLLLVSLIPTNDPDKSIFPDFLGSVFNNLTNGEKEGQTYPYVINLKDPSHVEVLLNFVDSFNSLFSGLKQYLSAIFHSFFQLDPWTISFRPYLYFFFSRDFLEEKNLEEKVNETPIVFSLNNQIENDPSIIIKNLPVAYTNLLINFRGIIPRSSVIDLAFSYYLYSLHEQLKSSFGSNIALYHKDNSLLTEVLQVCSDCRGNWWKESFFI